METHKVKKRLRDKSDRATRDKVLDSNTLKIITKLIHREKLSDFAGCISTGKEANVYTCSISNDLTSKLVKPTDVGVVAGAIKVYQTSIMEFKKRVRYIESETRFESFCKTNPRKLVKLWAEKEVRNLKRLNKVGILSPKPVYLKNNVLIMTMIGNKDRPAPRLKDAMILDLGATYAECVDLIGRMYKDANLIHADLSEYNLLYHDSRVFVIDVGQSVERCHENGHDFLINDINNINNFFRKAGVDVVSPREIFESVTGSRLPVCLGDMELTQGVFIPTRLDEIANREDILNFTATDEDRSDVYERSRPQRDEATGEERKLQLRDNKKKVKESNRVRRATKVPKKEKEKLRRLRGRGKKN